jgi:Tol biopolymer transport system component
MFSVLSPARFQASRRANRRRAAGLLGALLVAGGSSCVDEPVSPDQDPQRSGVTLALRATISGLAQGTYSLRLVVTYPNAEGIPTELPVIPERVTLTAGDDPAPQSFTIVDMSPCPQGCPLTATLILSDEVDELATNSLELGVVHQGDQVAPSGLIQLVPSYTLTITGGGAGSGSGTITVPEAGGQPALSCSIAVGQAAADGCSARYPLHTTLALTATEGLTAWGGDCASLPVSGPCELTMDGHRLAGASFAGRPTTGVLVVQIAGLPSGTETSVTVTNGRGYSNTLSQTDTLTDLPPGSDYSVAATSVLVSSEGRTYDPSPPTQAVTVVAGDTVVVQVGFNPPETGSLAISISGLPSGIPAQILVSGPGLSQPVPVSSDTTLSGLDPDLYTIVATEAGAGAPFGPYTPVPARQEVEVLPNQTAQARVAYAATRGALSVAISGLPPSNPANVTLTGPDGFTLPITGSRTIGQLLPGGYTLTSGNVPTPGRTYAPDKVSQAVQIAAGVEVRVSVGYSALPATTLEKAKGDSAICSVNSFCEDLFEVRARDATGSVVSGATVRWTAGDPSDGCPSGFHTDLSTDANGISKASNECKYPTPGTYHQTAALVVGGQVLTATQVAFTFTLVPGSVSPDRSTLAVSPSDIRTCCDAATVTVTARDGSGNPIEGATVVLNVSGTATSTNGPTAPTDSRGVAVATLSAKAIGTKIVTASINGIALPQRGVVQVSAGIAFGRFAGDIWVMNSDGSGAVDLTNTPRVETEPAWLPDGSRLAFVGFTCGEGFCIRDLYVMNADASDTINLTAGLGEMVSTPEWSPEGKRIAFAVRTCDECGDNVFVINADGSGFTSVTGESGGSSPTWSRDGSELAFARFSCGEFGCRTDILKQAVAGGFPTNLTSGISGDMSAPAWSPDGSRIAFVVQRCDTGCRSHIYVMNSDGTKPLDRTPDLNGTARAPTWSPDSRKIAYTVECSGEFCDDQIDVLDVAGSVPIQSIGFGFDPTWR